MEWPDGGGVYDQDPTLVNSWMEIFRIKADHEKREREKRERKRKQGKKR